jgi:hypothetical protein
VPAKSVCFTWTKAASARFPTCSGPGIPRASRTRRCRPGALPGECRGHPRLCHGAPLACGAHPVYRLQAVVELIDRIAQREQRMPLTIVVLDNASIHHGIDQEKLDDWLINDNLGQIQIKFPLVRHRSQRIQCLYPWVPDGAQLRPFQSSN